MQITVTESIVTKQVAIEWVVIIFTRGVFSYGRPYGTHKCALQCYMGLAEWIIDDSCLVISIFSNAWMYLDLVAR